MYNFEYLINELDCINKNKHYEKVHDEIKIVENYLKKLKILDKNTTLNIIEELINKLYFKIFDDSCMNDIRTIKLINKNKHKLYILSTFIIDNNTFKIKEHVEISFNGNLYKL